MNRAGAALVALAGGVILAACGSARARLYGRSAQTDLLHEAAGAVIVVSLLALGWVALEGHLGESRPDGGLPVELAPVIQFPSSRAA